jgi:hypothetical protein
VTVAGDVDVLDHACPMGSRPGVEMTGVDTT